MEKKSRNTIIISIVALAIVLITVTYAYFSARITGIESASTISLTAGRMEIVYSEGNEILSFSNIYPREEEWVTKTFTLTGYNTTTLTMYYNLGLNVTTNEFPDNYLTYDLTLVSSTNGTPIATKTNMPINGTGEIKFGRGAFSNANGDTHNYELKIYFKDNGLDQNDAQGAVFNASLYIKEDFEDAPEGWWDAQSGTLLAAIKSNQRTAQDTLTIPGYGYVGSLSTIDDNIIVKNQNLSSEYQEYYWTYSDSIEQITSGNNSGNFRLINPQTCKYSECYSNLVGKYILNALPALGAKSTNTVITNTSNMIYRIESTSPTGFNYKKANTLEISERVLASTRDDYGTSYYYRGVVENNYVVFADMCWRIVRVDGAGNTKLVLFNYNPNNVQNPCATSEDGDTNAFARYNNTYTSKFNANRNKNTYIGYMYSSNPDSTDFDIGHANDNDSAILTFLKNWYDEKLRSYNDKLADVIWCNDKSIVTDITYNPDSWGNYNSPDGLSNHITYYQARRREGSPTLVCPSAGSDGKLSKFTARDAINGNAKLYSNNKEYKIGLLTMDEMIFAGSTGISFHYLNKNIGENSYWTLSPYSFGGGSAVMWIYLGDSYLWRQEVGYALAVRPAIALKPDTIISDGVGTSSNPFVVFY